MGFSGLPVGGQGAVGGGGPKDQQLQTHLDQQQHQQERSTEPRPLPDNRPPQHHQHQQRGSAPTPFLNPPPPPAPQPQPSLSYPYQRGGSLITRLEERGSAALRRFGEPHITIGWYELEQALLALLPPGTVQYGAQYLGHRERDDGVYVAFSPGRTFLSHCLAGGDVGWEAVVTEADLRQCGFRYNTSTRRVERLSTPPRHTPSLRTEPRPSGVVEAGVWRHGLNKEALRRYEAERKPRWRHVMQVGRAGHGSQQHPFGYQLRPFGCPARLQLRPARRGLSAPAAAAGLAAGGRAAAGGGGVAADRYARVCLLV
eukprot:XP_001690801.1 predicted protein [Chlamydomonas reinhardtii]